jgi:hypothetical protein
MGRLQQTTQDFNLDARFGRNEAAIERVAPDSREQFAARHREWGNMVRVADVELAGIKPQGDSKADVLVRVAWYSTAENDLRVTTVKQSWRDGGVGGSWQLVSEERADGDVGLFGEPVVRQIPAERQAPAQFPTITLGGSSEASE